MFWEHLGFTRLAIKLPGSVGLVIGLAALTNDAGKPV